MPEGLILAVFIDFSGEKNGICDSMRGFQCAEEAYFGDIGAGEVYLNKRERFLILGSTSVPLQKGQFQSICLRLHRVQQNALARLTVDDAGFSGVDTSLVGGWEDFVSITSGRIEICHHAKRCGVTGQRLFQDFKV
jgi:hypothetical protein